MRYSPTLVEHFLNPRNAGRMPAAAFQYQAGRG